MLLKIIVIQIKVMHSKASSGSGLYKHWQCSFKTNSVHLTLKVLLCVVQSKNENYIIERTYTYIIDIYIYRER